MKGIKILSVLIFCFSGLLSAQTRVFDEKMEVRGDSVVVSFRTDSEKEVPYRYKEVILPYVHNGKDTMYFAPMEVYGKGRYMHLRQEKYLAGEKDWELGRNQILAGEAYGYVSAVALKRWMTSASLGIKRHLSGCNCDRSYSDETLGAPHRLFEVPEAPQRRIPECVLTDVAHTWDFGQDELEIIFKVSDIEMDSTVFNNEVTFGKILEAVDRIYSNPHLKVSKIEIAGYASPEGRQSFNTWLGHGRAAALRDYIIKERPQYGLKPDDFNLRNGEENWEGLRRHLLASGIDEKDVVVSIIDSDATPEDKKAAIKSLEGGRVWKKMLKEVYPHLRCARYLAVWYDSPDGDIVDRINEANVMIRDGRYEEAYEHLVPCSDDFRAFNSIGAALMMQGKFEEALPWLRKAVEEGNCMKARENVRAIEAELERESLRRKEIEEYLNKYN